jgi:hypothetical protein
MEIRLADGPLHLAQLNLCRRKNVIHIYLGPGSSNARLAFGDRRGQARSLALPYPDCS